MLHVRVRALHVQHLREAFEDTSNVFEVLLKAYPDYFQPHWFGWGAYVWAAELWYAYAIQASASRGVALGRGLGFRGLGRWGLGWVGPRACCIQMMGGRAR